MYKYKTNYRIDGKVHRTEEVAALDIVHAASQLEIMYPEAELYKTICHDITTTADGFKKFDINIVWQSVDKNYDMFHRKYFPEIYWFDRVEKQIGLKISNKIYEYSTMKGLVDEHNFLTEIDERFVTGFIPGVYRFVSRSDIELSIRRPVNAVEAEMVQQ